MKNALVFLLSVLTLSLYAQIDYESIHPCNTVKIQDAHMAAHPELAEEFKALEQQLIEEEMNLPSHLRSGSIIQIPIVFHVIHNYGIENISDEQIENCVEVMNQQLRLQNANASLIHDEFIDLAADTEIEFVLARKDPNGNCTTGINRLASTQTYDGDQDMKELIQWPRNMYCNIWVCADANGAAGYTIKPNAVQNFPQADGIVIRHDYVGAIGTSNPTRSVALTHEVGHWLNLNHVWGNNNNAGIDCGNDGVNDTPITEGWTSCNINGETCGTLDNVENYMDYSYCCKMFTEGQKTRMRTAAMSSVAQRNQLSSNNNLIATGVVNGDVLCQAQMEANYTTVCFGDTVQFFDVSYHNVQSRLWDFPGGTPSTSTEENPKVVYSAPGSYNVTLSVSDGSSSLSETFTNYITILESNGTELPFIEGFENGLNDFNENWEVVNFDNDEGWEYTDQASASGGSSIWINNRYNEAGQIDEIISEPIDISDFEEVEVSFKYAYSERNTANNEKLRMYVSKDCGRLWSLRKSLQGNSFSTNGGLSGANWFPSDDDWSEVSITNILENYYVGNLLLKFRFESDGGNNVFIDDINISDTYVGLVTMADEEYKFKVFPNPTRDLLNVVFELENIEDISWRVKDLSGRTVSEGIYSNPEMGKNKFQVNTTAWTNGIYIFEMLTNKGVIAQKIMTN
ncbi:MAG: T9SS type A sorting domain-containing protein [Flavobacteriales bacterium]|nr:T9SS type A sorting domain-containing protein [Flavobacteriales bacterium]